MKLIEYKIKDFNKELAGDSPAPGGGSVAGLSAALGAGLASMVVNLTEGEELEECGPELEKLRCRAEELIDEDTECFNQVMAAYKMSKDTEGEKEKRRVAIQEALKEASLTPLETMKMGLKILELTRKVVEKGNPNARSDAGVAGLMALAAVKGGYYNVCINTASLSDEKTAGNLERDAEFVREKAEKIAAEIEGIVTG